MRTRGRVYQEPRLTDSDREVAERCPRNCGGLLAEETQRGANNSYASVLFCVNPDCGWREWTVEDVCSDIERLAAKGAKPAEIARQLGLSERTVFRRLARRAA